MDRVLQEIILFLFTYIFVFLAYLLFIVRRAKRKPKGKKKPKEPLEVTYLVNRYGLDLKKVDYNRLLIVISLVSSFDIALIVSIILSIKIFVLEIIVGFISMMGIILLSYHLVYLVYKKKGMIKDESKRNRK